MKAHWQALVFLGEEGCYFWLRNLPHLAWIKATRLEVSLGLKTVLVISIQESARDWCLFATEKHLYVLYLPFCHVWG